MDVEACPCGKNFRDIELYGETALQCEGCGNVLVSLESQEQIFKRIKRSYTPSDLEDLRIQCRGRMEALVSSVRAEPRLYFECPVCEKTMSRRSFAAGSGIVVHQCPAHGTLGAFNWLKQAVEFVEKGGEVLVLKDELDEANKKIRDLQNQREGDRRRGHLPIFIP